MFLLLYFVIKACHLWTWCIVSIKECNLISMVHLALKTLSLTLPSFLWKAVVFKFGPVLSSNSCLQVWFSFLCLTYHHNSNSNWCKNDYSTILGIVSLSNCLILIHNLSLMNSDEWIPMCGLKLNKHKVLNSPDIKSLFLALSPATYSVMWIL